MKRKITGNGEENKPTRRVVTRFQAKLRALATPKKQPPATSSTNRFGDLKEKDVVNQSREKRCQLCKDPSPPLACFVSASSSDSNCQGTTSPTTDQSLRSLGLNDHTELGGSNAKTPPQAVPCPSSSPVIGPRFLSPGSSFRPASGDVQAAEPRGVGRTDTTAQQLWHATTCRKYFSRMSGRKACNPKTPLPVDYLSASVADKVVAVTDGFCPTSIAENAKPSLESIEDQPDQHDIPGPACSMGLTDYVNMMDGHDLGEEDVESVGLVTVGNYRVKPSSKPTLDLIFHKYGDIAANLDMEILENRSLVLEEVCQIIQAFQVKNLTDVSQVELRRAVERLRHWKKSGLEILWLLERLEGVLEARQTLHRSSALKHEKDTNAEAFKSKKSEVEELAQKKIFFREEIQKMMLDEQAVTQKMISSKQELEATEAELQKTNEKISEAKRKISPYAGCPILDKLL